MKILFLASGTVRSNFTYRVLKLGSALREHGHEVSIIAPSADKYNNFVAEKIDVLDGVRILQPFQFNTKRLEINLIPYLIGASYKVLKEKADLIYIYKPTPISIVGLLGKLFYGTQVVLDMDDLGSEVMKIEGHPFYQRKLVEWCERLAAWYADRIVAASTYLRDKYQTEFPKKPVYLMSNGVDKPWFAPLDPVKGKAKIVFMGSINRRNILEPLFEVLPDIIKKHPDLQTLIMGDGKDLNYFKEKTERLKIGENVTFTGWLTIDKARANLEAGDIGYNYMPLESTIKAASNMKTPQYMARGVVPLVSDVGDLAASVDFGKAGYICASNNAPALEAELLRALADPHRMEKSAHGRLLSIERFDWEVLASGFEQWLGVNTILPKKREHKKIYFVAVNVPGDFGGAEIRNFNLIKQLLKQPDVSVEVFGISDKDPERDRRNLESQLDVSAHIVAKKPSSLITSIRAIFFERMQPFMTEYRLSGLGETFRVACERSLPDIVQIEQMDTYYCLSPHLEWLRKNGVKIILDTHNVEFLAFAEAIHIFPPMKALVGKWLLPNLKKMEVDAATRFDMIFAVSDVDAEFFRKYNSHVTVITNGVDCEQFQPADPAKHPALIFIGGVQYPPNGDALRFYLKTIHPKMMALFPNLKLLAIGATSDWLDAENLNDPSVEPLGFVDDIRPYLAQASIGICPIRYGSGTRLKVLTYMAAGLPIVSTTKGAEGIGYTKSKDLLIADEPAAFVEALSTLLNNRHTAQTIGSHARELAVGRYSWNVIGEKLLEAYQQ